MPQDNGDMKHRNGALVQHSDKWSERNRRPNSHMAGQGSRGSRNQGTGIAGQANTVASQGVDTSKMGEHEKLKYFNSLGLLNPAQKQKLADLEKEKVVPAPEPESKPESKAAPASNPVKELSDKLTRIFANKPQLLQGIVKQLQSVPKDELKDKAQAVLKAMEHNSSTDPTEVFSTIMQSIEGKHEVPHSTDVDSEDDIKFDDEQEEKADNFYPDLDEVKEDQESFKRVMDNKFNFSKFKTFDELRQDRNAWLSFRDYINFLDKPMYKKLKDYINYKVNDYNSEAGEDSKYTNFNDAAFDILRYGLEGSDGTESNDTSTQDFDDSDEYAQNYEREEEKSRGLEQQYGYMSENDFRKDFAFLGNNKVESLIKQAKQFNNYNAALSAIALGVDNADPNNDDEIYSSMQSAADDLSAMGFDVKDQSDSDYSSTESGKVSPEQLSPTGKHTYDSDPEVFQQPTLEDALKLSRQHAADARVDDFKRFLQYASEGMKAQGVDSGMINRTLNYYLDKLKHNGWKFQTAMNAMVDNAEGYDPDESTEFDHNIASFESGMESYDKDPSRYEEQIAHVYNQLHGK